MFPARPWFYPGTNRPNWLWDGQARVPLMVSQRTLGSYGCDALRPAVVPWALDSGGFTELSMYGRWTLRPEVYVGMVADWDRVIGGLDWAAPQDWMCEPEIIHGGIISGRRAPGTGLSVAEHQRRTVGSYLTLRDLWPQHSDDSCPFVPVLQGWLPEEYLACAALYEAAGVDLRAAPLVGLGSVCRRQGDAVIGWLVDLLAPDYSLHAFGAKTRGLPRYGRRLASADSLAWSLDARHSPPLPGHTHKACSSCPGYALRWLARLVDQIAAADHAGYQDSLFSQAA